MSPFPGPLFGFSPRDLLVILPRVIRRRLWARTAPLLAVLVRRLPSSLRLTLLGLATPSFTVGVKAVCLNERGQALVLEHHFQPSDRRWGLPGGLVGDEAGLEDNLRREIREETGLEVEIVAPLRNVRARRLITLIYLCRVAGEPRRLQSSEVGAWQWCDPANPTVPIHPHEREALRLAALYRQSERLSYPDN